MKEIQEINDELKRCYEGITFEQVVGKWNYQKQLLYFELARENKEDMTIFF